MINQIKRMKAYIVKSTYRFLYMISRSLFSFSSNRVAKNRQTIQSLKNIHDGKRCFIIGNGPSLKAEDLEKIAINGDISFAANKINAIFPKTQWRPTYYSVTDETYQRTLQDTMNEVPAEYKFFRQESYKWNKNVKGNCLFINADGNINLLDKPRFSSDISDVVYTIGTVTSALLQIAVYMGFKEIYFLGMDNNYATNRLKDGTIVRGNSVGQSYFEGIKEAKPKQNTQGVSTWQMDVAFEVAKEYADNNDIKIYNATRGGKLEVYPRVDFDGLFHE